MGIFFSVAERKGRNKQPRMPIFLPEFQPYVAVSFKLICKDFLVSMIFGHFVFHATAKSHICLKILYLHTKKNKSTT